MEIQPNLLELAAPVAAVEQGQVVLPSAERHLGSRGRGQGGAASVGRERSAHRLAVHRAQRGRSAL